MGETIGGLFTGPAISILCQRMRLISFSLTSPQLLSGHKTVTRRSGWLGLKAGDRLMACEKSRGRRPGEKIVELGTIEITQVQRERLDRLLQSAAYGREECRLEGFPDLSPQEFVKFFCRSHRGCKQNSMVTRIEFRKII